MIKRKTAKIFFVSFALTIFLFGNLSGAAAAVNYGTTTFFSGTENEKPPVSVPILDVGGITPDWNSDDEDNDTEENILDKITDGLGNIFGNSNNYPALDETNNSLFDFQKNIGDEKSMNDNQGEFIMGARGESLENIDDEDAAKYNNRITDSFNFKENNASSSPKKSKLLFTNIMIPVDLTTQYILISFVFIIIIGLVVGYYFWKKETTKAVINPNEDYYI
jgi:hypothetical protein